MKKEEKAVFKSKILVALAIVCCAVAVTVAVYLLTRSNDLNNFEVEVSSSLMEFSGSF
jgi:high-affinity Fe2+/Pb2+ permease